MNKFTKGPLLERGGVDAKAAGRADGVVSINETIRTPPRPFGPPLLVRGGDSFTGKANPLSQQGLDTACQFLGIGAAEIWTLLTVETKGCGYLPDRRPVILFERHIFHKQTGGAHGSAEPGGYLGGAKEYDRLEEAMALDAHAAMNSTSWGIGQVMGFNSKLAGFPSVETMVEAMIENEDAQLSAVAHCLRADKLHVFLAAHQWEAFAMGYNGPNYKENNYDTKLAATYAGFSEGPLPQIPVRQAQLLLTFQGFHVGAIDGIPGKQTLNAIAQFLPTDPNAINAGTPCLRDSP